MKILAALVALVLAASPALAARPLYTIYTGTPKGTYLQIAEDIQRACPMFEINIEQTQGTLQNLNALITVPVVKNGYRFAFAQKDALDTITSAEPLAKQVYKVVSPLYKEEISILVNKSSNIRTLADLNGKKVAGGTPGSGAWFTSTAIRNALGLKWTQIDKSREESILMVLTGEVDAMIAVGGAPNRLFQELGKSMSERIALLPITSPQLDKIYATTKIPARTYLWQDEEVVTKSTQSILVAAADVPDSAIKELQTCLARNLSSIRKFGHPKWQEITMSLPAQS